MRYGRAIDAISYICIVSSQALAAYIREYQRAIPQEYPLDAFA